MRMCVKTFMMKAIIMMKVMMTTGSTFESCLSIKAPISVPGRVPVGGKFSKPTKNSFLSPQSSAQRLSWPLTPSQVPCLPCMSSVFLFPCMSGNLTNQLHNDRGDLRYAMVRRTMEALSSWEVIAPGRGSICKIIIIRRWHLQHWPDLVKPPLANSAVFLTLFKRPLNPPPSFWTCMLQFFFNNF